MSADPLAPLLGLSGVPEAVDAARAAIDGLLKERVLRTRRAEVRAAALARAAEASTQLDHPAATSALPGALRVMADVPSLARTWGRAPLQALARLHALATVDDVSPDRLGRPRDDADTAERLTQLAEATLASDAPGIVVAAVVHGELLTLAPFVSGNGLVARAAQRLVLVQRGVDPDALTVPEEGLLQLGGDRYRAAAAAFASGTPAGLAEWLTVTAASVQRGAAYTRGLCARLDG